MERKVSLNKVLFMLKKLSISNYKLIDSLEIVFSEQLTIISGETGAGKSILLDAIRLILGDRGSPQMIKNQDASLIVEAEFENITSSTEEVLNKFEIEPDEKSLQIYRQINSSGKNIIRINGLPANVKILKDIGEHLIDLCSQNQHQSLFYKSNHKEMLDSFAKKETSELLEKLNPLRQKYLNLILQKKYVHDNLQKIEKEKDFLQFQIEEIADANLSENEDNILSEQKNKIASASKLADNSASAIGHITSADEILRNALRDVDQMSAIDSSTDQLKSDLENAIYTLEDVLRETRTYNENIEHSPEALHEIEERLFTINNLKRKYGPSLHDVITTLEKLQIEIDRFDSPDYNIEQINKEIDTLENGIADICSKLSYLRNKSAKMIEDMIKQEFKELALPHARFKIGIVSQETEEGIAINDKRVKLYTDGIDDIEFLFSANPDSEVGPLNKIASGGELSRVMLALKNIFGKSQKKQSIIFDEIDTGISGITAQKVGNKIKQLSDQYQIICVSHLASIAAKGNTHLLVDKSVIDNKTSIKVSKLSDSDREKEIARLLGGDISKTTIQHAKELLNW